MFCSKCGNNLNEGAKFCTNCGNHLSTNCSEYKASTFNILDFKYFLDFFILSLKSQSKAKKEFLNKFTVYSSAIYFAIISIISAFISAFSIKSFINLSLNRLQKFVFSMSNSMSNDIFSDYSTSNEYISILDEVTTPLKKIIPFDKLFYWCLLGLLIFFILMMILSFLCHNIVFKCTADFKEYLVAASITLNVKLIFVIIIAIFSLINIYLAIFCLMVSSIVITIILYKGLSSICKDESKFIYLYSFSYAISNALTTYVILKLISNHLIFSNLKNLFSSFL